MRLQILLVFFQPLLVGAADAERTLPADLQVDLIFPRNETYAPTQWFPIVFGVQNLDAVWPLDIRLDVYVESKNWRLSGKQSDSWQYEIPSLTYEEFREAAGPMPGKHFFHFPLVNMTNGTTDQYSIGWELRLLNRCFANNTDPQLDDGGDGWRSHGPNPYALRFIQFSSAPGAQLPDIEATVNSCAEPDEGTSASVRVTEVRKTSDTGAPCPVLDTNVTTINCGYKPVAKELAANVSAAIMDKMRCNEGAWQTITAPCPRKSIASSRFARAAAVMHINLEPGN
ncbi:hypothetical protein DL766_005517 [Monosporascus sp. MC13-8B]|nr:hypothetical protein DL766_005517 [Monosporascus sp. MC13-8B]